MSDVLKYFKLDKVDNKTKYVIFGFVRECQLLLPKTSVYYNIPISFNHLIIAFYYQYEEFYKVSSNISLSQENRLLKVDYRGDWCNAFGKLAIESMSKVHCYWKIKCVKETNNMFIGIATHRNIDSPYQYNYSHLFYAFFNDDGYDEIGEIRTTDGQNEIAESYGQGYKQGDIVTIDLNLKRRELKFHVNDNINDVAFDGIKCDENTTYYLAIGVLGALHKMSIIEFGHY